MILVGLVVAAMESDKGNPKQNPDAETDDFSEACEYFEKFLLHIKAKQVAGLQPETTERLEQLKFKMKTFIDEQEKGCISKASKGEYSPSRNPSKVKSNSIDWSNDLKIGDRVFVKSKHNHEQATDSDGKSDAVSGASSRKSRCSTRHRSTRSKSHRNSRRSSSSESEYTNRNREPRRLLDLRQVPKLECFNEDSGQDLDKYLDRFETYCRNNYRGGNEFWLGLLEDHLNGKILKTFKLWQNNGMNYYEMKDKLLKWYKDNSELREKKYKTKFKEAQLKPNEGLYNFSIRLETLFRKAYPYKDVARSKKLIEQFKRVIPKKERDYLSIQEMPYKVNNQKPTWDFVQKCVKIRDLDEELGQESESGNEFRQNKREEIVINMGRRNRSPENTGKGFGPQGKQDPSSNVCFVCKKKGHFAWECRWCLGLCILCGEKGHYVRNCPKKTRNFSTDSRIRRRSNSRERGPTYPSASNQLNYRRSTSSSRFSRNHHPTENHNLTGANTTPCPTDRTPRRYNGTTYYDNPRNDLRQYRHAPEFHPRNRNPMNSETNNNQASN